MDELLTDTHIHIISAQMCIANAQEELEKLAALSLRTGQTRSRVYCEGAPSVTPGVILRFIK